MIALQKQINELVFMKMTLYTVSKKRVITVLVTCMSSYGKQNKTPFTCSE